MPEIGKKKRKKKEDDDTEVLEFCFICGELLDWLGWCSCCSKD